MKIYFPFWTRWQIQRYLVCSIVIVLIGNTFDLIWLKTDLWTPQHHRIGKIGAQLHTRTSCLRITAPRGRLNHTGKKRRHTHFSQSTALNETIRDSRLCEAAHHLLGTDLRQKHQIGVWIKFFLTFNKIKVLKNIFFPPLHHQHSKSNQHHSTRDTSTSTCQDCWRVEGAN